MPLPCPRPRPTFSPQSNHGPITTSAPSNDGVVPQIDTFAQRLDKTLSEVTKKALQQSAKEATASDQSEPPPPPSADDEQEADEAQPPVQENPPGV
eukprot:1446381-Rhodomonas_salina.3